MPFFFSLLLGAALVLTATPAFAWGPGVHTALGNVLLGNLALLAPALRECIVGNANMFLYGCLSADIFIGKGSKYTPGHSHNWATGLRLLESAGNKRLKAFAYGYLSHLAADVVAHNFYVPGMLLKAPTGGTAGHILVEMQADAHIEWCGFKAGRNFLPRRREAEAALLSAVRQTKKAPFRIKKGIYQGSLFLSKAAPKGKSAAFLERMLPQNNGAASLQAALNTALSLTVHCLNNTDASLALQYDPIGESALKAAAAKRRGTSDHNEDAFSLPVELLQVPSCGIVFPFLKKTMPSAA